MAEEAEILNFFDIQIEHFPDRSARWLLQDRENVRGLLEIVAAELVELIDFSQLSQINRVLFLTTCESRNLTSSLAFHCIANRKRTSCSSISSLNTNRRLT